MLFIPIDGHRSGVCTAHKILQCGYYSPTITQDAHDLSKSCDSCQRERGISTKQELPMTHILVIELFDIWSLVFMGLFVSSNGMTYIVIVVEYASKWVKAFVLSNNKGKRFVAFLKRISSSYLVNQGSLLAMEVPTFVMICSITLK